ncbi:hypothetical protein ABE82_26650 (plasmid) [Paenibacillus peoriae]|uniref:hypothetical protein n=1 Tax=Paenibacillus peoriae TaxID=59893 RepID=UPI00072207AE|nr:hypothetical protein [Paenibacillus peoriae]ALS09993.1 hypothetical protein ABE82_26650 [Paenibacillus peoriae]
MTREDVLNARIEKIKDEIENVDRKIKAEAKKLMEDVQPKSLMKLCDYKLQRKKLFQLQFELYAILGASIK